LPSPTVGSPNEASLSEVLSPKRAPTRKGTTNPLILPFVLNPFPQLGNTLDGQPPQPSGEPSGSSTPTQGLILHPFGALVDEPNDSMTDLWLPIRNSTEADVPAVIPSSSTGLAHWLGGDSLTTTPMDTVFPHVQTALPPMARDFQMKKSHTQVKSPTIEEPNRPQATIVRTGLCKKISRRLMGIAPCFLFCRLPLPHAMMRRKRWI